MINGFIKSGSSFSYTLLISPSREVSEVSDISTQSEAIFMSRNIVTGLQIIEQIPTFLMSQNCIIKY